MLRPDFLEIQIQILCVWLCLCVLIVTIKVSGLHHIMKQQYDRLLNSDHLRAGTLGS